MALGTNLKVSLLRDSSINLLSSNSHSVYDLRHLLDGHTSAMPVRQRRATKVGQPVHVAASAVSPGNPQEDGQRAEGARGKWTLTNPKPAFWKEMPEPREFSEGHSFLVPEKQKTSRQADLRRKRAMYAQMTGGGAKKVTTDPKLLKMLDYRLTSGEHKGKMLREVSRKYLEWLATTAAPLKPLQKGDLSKVVLRSSKEVNDPAEMAAFVLQLPEIKDTVRQVDIEEMQEAALAGKGKGKGLGKASTTDDVYKTAFFKLKSLNIQVELEKKAVEDRRNAARMAVEAGAIEDPSEARRVRRRVKQWQEAEVQKKVGLAKTIEERRLQEMEAEGEEAMKSSYGVATSGSSGAALAPGQLPVFKGREEMLSVAKQAMMKAKIRPSQLKDVDIDLGRSFGDDSVGQQKVPKRGRPAKKGTGEGGSKVDWRAVNKRNPTSS